MFMYNGKKKDCIGDKFLETKFFEAFFQIFPLLFRALSEKNCQYWQFFGKSLKSWQKCEYVHQKECFFYFSIEWGLFLDHFSPFPPIRLGTIQILRKQMGWVGGLGQMLTFAYMLGGWVIANAYVSKKAKNWYHPWSCKLCSSPASSCFFGKKLLKS